MRTITFFFALLLLQHTHAQWFNTTSTFTTQNGLSNNTITCLQKSEDGFLWIGTHEGLNRYDGTEFVNILRNTKNNLPSNNILKICFLNKTLMAVSTDAGLCLLNAGTFYGQTISLPYNPTFSTTGFYISDILYNESSHELWVGTWHGIFVLNDSGLVKRKIMSNETGMGNAAFVQYLFKDEQENIYFFSQQRRGFFYPNFEGNALVPVEKKRGNFALNALLQSGYALMGANTLGHETVCIFSKKTGSGTDEYLSYSNTASGRRYADHLLVDFPYEKRMSNAFPLNDSTLIINSFFGEPLLYNSNTHHLKKASEQPLWFTSWPDGFNATVFRDNRNIWVGTSKGLLQSSLKTNFFSTSSIFVNHLKANNNLVSFNYGIYNAGKLWIACIGAGLSNLDTANNTVQDFFDTHTPAIYKKKLISTEIVPIEKSLWLFSVYGPVQVNTKPKSLSTIKGINKDSLFDESAKYPMLDTEGNLWTTLLNGVSKYHIASKTFTNYKTQHKGGLFPLLRAGPKTDDRHGNIWMARQDTLVKYEKKTNTFSTTLLSKDTKALRPITTMASDGNNLLYLSVAGSFGIYNIDANTIDLFTKQTGIISTAINDLASDYAGNAWIATEGGLVFYNKQKKKFSSFTKADGLPDDNVISLNFTDTSRKTLFLGFSKTYCLFEPQHFLLEKTVPTNIITSVVIDNEPLAINIKKQLTYSQNSIYFTYTGINYNQGQQNNYACMLEGIDKDWKYTGTERKINYINLPPGDYTFKVKSANHQGEWNEQPAIFQFQIYPPFWQRWWFRGFAICLLIFSVYYILKSRELAFKKTNNIKLQMSELRMQALRAQMNPHFIFNSLNSIQSYILNNNTIEAAGYLSKFAKLMRRILDQSKHNFLPLGEVMETLKLYVEMEAFRFNNEFSYTFNIEDNDDLLDARIPPMLLQPFVENSILHGLMPKEGNKKLVIDCVLINKNVEITIDDNGIGRTQNEAKAGHESQGEKLTSGMLESLQQIQNNKATIHKIDKTENNTPSGTTVTLVLPLN